MPRAPEALPPSEPPPNPLWELFLFRMRALVREPASLFWIFAFPLLTSVALGIAFKNRGAVELDIAVAAGAPYDAEAKKLDEVQGLAVVRADPEEGRELVRRGRVALMVTPGDRPQFLIDPTQSEARTAELLTRDALERMRGREDRLAPERHEVDEPGARYIDFLIPGLLGFGLMSSSIWGLGWALVQMRSGKLLKRLVATPMKRSQFLGSFLMSRLVLCLFEAGFFALFARLLFDVRIFGSVATFFLVSLFGAAAFGGVGLLVASRAKSSETASGLMNLVTMPMMVLSGVFFSASKFPALIQPLIRLLPLTALNDALRAVMIDGAALSALGGHLAVLTLWGVVSSALALRWFRWT